MCKRDKFHIAAKKGKNNALTKFRQMKSQINKLIRKAYWSYIESIISYNPDHNAAESRSTNKKSWSFIKNRRQDCTGVSPLKCLGKIYNGAVEKANVLNHQFQSIFSVPSPLSLKQICNANFQNLR